LTLGLRGHSGIHTKVVIHPSLTRKRFTIDTRPFLMSRLFRHFEGRGSSQRRLHLQCIR
jgi:hypothetical protein